MQHFLETELPLLAVRSSNRAGAKPYTVTDKNQSANQSFQSCFPSLSVGCNSSKRCMHRMSPQHHSMASAESFRFSAASAVCRGQARACRQRCQLRNNSAEPPGPPEPAAQAPDAALRAVVPKRQKDAKTKARCLRGKRRGKNIETQLWLPNHHLLHRWWKSCGWKWLNTRNSMPAQTQMNT